MGSDSGACGLTPGTGGFPHPDSQRREMASATSKVNLVAFNLVPFLLISLAMLRNALVI